MTDKIKVKGKKYLSESSERKELFATEYEAAVKKGYQEFMLKIEDSEADAVTAFLNLLNELQETSKLTAFEILTYDLRKKNFEEKRIDLKKTVEKYTSEYMILR